MESCVYMLSQKPECKLQSKQSNTSTTNEVTKKSKSKQKELQLI